MQGEFDISGPIQKQAADGRNAWTVPVEVCELADNDREIIAELVEVFRSDTASRLQRIREALTVMNLAELRAEIHTIKGSAGQMGVQTMASLCRQIELSILEAPPSQLAESVRELEAHFDGICLIMELYCDQTACSEALALR